MRRLPSYAELLQRTDAPPGSSWGLFGAGDRRGTLNLLDDAAALRAAGLVRRGARFNLDYPLDAFAPSLSASRAEARHVIDAHFDGQMFDDHLDQFHLQISSQIDALRHHRHPRYGFYNGTPDLEVFEHGALGIQVAADVPIVGRGVLLDIKAQLERHGAPLGSADAIDVAVLEETAAAQDVELQQGDILLIHTGWAQYAAETLGRAERAAIARDLGTCGLRQTRETLAWIWDHGIALLASDTFAVEAMPPVPDSPFAESVLGMMHPELLTLLGIHLGELWKLDELARDCADDRIYEFLVTAKPLDLVGGVGSPANAIAVK